MKIYGYTRRYINRIPPAFHYLVLGAIILQGKKGLKKVVFIKKTRCHKIDIWHHIHKFYESVFCPLFKLPG